jgi:hypothetical protein
MSAYVRSHGSEELNAVLQLAKKQALSKNGEGFSMFDDQ